MKFYIFLRRAKQQSKPEESQIKYHFKHLALIMLLLLRSHKLYSPPVKRKGNQLSHCEQEKLLMKCFEECTPISLMETRQIMSALIPFRSLGNRNLIFLGLKANEILIFNSDTASCKHWDKKKRKTEVLMGLKSLDLLLPEMEKLFDSQILHRAPNKQLQER